MRFSAMPIVFAGLTTLLAGGAKAASFATFVSGTGTDSGVCTEAAPCRSFQFALKQTRPGGAISAISAGSFGPVRITTSVSIVADGVTALIESSVNCSGSLRAAVCISGAADVTVRGLTINLHQTNSSSLSGILVTSGGALHVQHCLIRAAGGSGVEFMPTSSGILYVSGSTLSDIAGGSGIDFEPSSPSSLYVSHTTLSGTTQDGIRFLPHAGGSYTAAFDHVTAQNNVSNGLTFDTTDGSSSENGVVRDSTFAGNGSSGIEVGGFTNLTIDRTTVSTNVTGITVAGSRATALVGNSTIVGNATGLLSSLSGQTLSFGTNKLIANGANGSFTGAVGMQ